MTMTEAVADIHARISEIHARFGATPPPAVVAGSASQPFSQVLAAATLGSLMSMPMFYQMEYMVLFIMLLAIGEKLYSII